MKNQKKYGIGWAVSFPENSRIYQVIPVSDDQYNPSKLIPYWEGLFRMMDEKGTFIGVQQFLSSEHIH
jgi:hypothetical protein